MRWSAEEKLRRALPYGVWKWSGEAGVVTETLFNRHYRAIATRVGGQLVAELLEPPRSPWRAAEYYYGLGTNSPQNGYPWRDRAAREASREVLRAWGIDPDEAETRAAAEIRDERRPKPTLRLLRWHRPRIRPADLIGIADVEFRYDKEPTLGVEIWRRDGRLCCELPNEDWFSPRLGRQIITVVRKADPDAFDAGARR